MEGNNRCGHSKCVRQHGNANSHTDRTGEADKVCYAISPYASNCMLSDNPRSGIYEADTARTLDNNGGNPACNQGGVDDSGEG